MTRKSLVVLGATVAAVLLAAPALAGGGADLEGKSFSVTVTLPDGKTLENTYTFKGGNVESALCVAAGYPAAPYTVKHEEGKTVVTAVLKNESGGQRTVTAWISGGGMKGTVDVNEGGETMQLTFAPKGDKS